jgi:hypothetical protein
MDSPETEVKGKGPEAGPVSEDKRAKRDRVVPPERWKPEVKDKEDFVIRQVRIDGCPMIW